MATPSSPKLTFVSGHGSFGLIRKVKRESDGFVCILRAPPPSEKVSNLTRSCAAKKSIISGCHRKSASNYMLSSRYWVLYGIQTSWPTIIGITWRPLRTYTYIWNSAAVETWARQSRNLRRRISMQRSRLYGACLPSLLRLSTGATTE